MCILSQFLKIGVTGDSNENIVEERNNWLLKVKLLNEKKEGNSLWLGRNNREWWFCSYEMVDSETRLNLALSGIVFVP